MWRGLVLLVYLTNVRGDFISQVTRQARWEGLIGDKTLLNKLSCQECQDITFKAREIISSKTSLTKKRDALAELCLGAVPPGDYNLPLTCKFLVKQYYPSLAKLTGEGWHKEQEICWSVGICEDTRVNNTLPMSQLARDQGMGVKLTPVQVSKRSQVPSETFTFVQLSDIHIDPQYTVGASTKCFAPICCQKKSITGSGSAGKWGDYNCDAREITVAAQLDFIRQLDPKPDFFIYIGDNSPHNVLETPKAKQKDNLDVTNLLLDKLRDKGQIYPALGNHETFPNSQYYRTMPSAQRLLKSLAIQWPQMFNASSEEKQTIRDHAYYSTLVRPGLRVLSFNSMYEYLLNTMASMSFMDKFKKKQTDFVKQTLRNARKNGEKVIFISHMKPGVSNTYPRYNRFLDELTTEFNDVIILQLYGHEHIDLFQLNKNPKDRSKVTGVSLAAPSMTTYQSMKKGINPSFRVFTLDAKDFSPLDYTQYYIDLPKANRDNKAEVKKHYSFTEEYNLPDLSVASYTRLAESIIKDFSMYKKFEDNTDVMVGSLPRCAENDMKCRRKLTCQTTEADPVKFALCTKGF